MKRIVLIVLLVFASISIYAQTPKYQEEERINYVGKLLGLDNSPFTKMGNSLIHVKVGSHCKDYYYWRANKLFIEQFNSRLPESIMYDLDSYSYGHSLSAIDKYDDFITSRIDGIDLYTKYKDGVHSLLKSLERVNGNSLMFYISQYSSPVYFTLTNGQVTAFAETVSTTTPNILKKDYQRMAIIINELSEGLKCFSDKFDNSVKFYGLTVIYLSKSMIEDEWDGISEALSVIIPSVKVTDYVNLKISQEELLHTADIYYTYSSGKSQDTRKVDIEMILGSK